MNIKDFMSKEQLENYNNNSEEEYQNVTENVLKIKVTDIAAEFYRNKGRDDNTYNTLEDLYFFKDINTIRDLVSLSPEELAFKVGRYGEKGYNDVVNVLKMYGIDVNRYINYQYNVDILSFGLQEFSHKLSIRTYNALLHSRKVETIKDLARLSPKELMQIRGIGKKGYNEVVNLLKICGIGTNDNTGGMTRYKPNIDLDKKKDYKIVDPMHELLETDIIPNPSLGGTNDIRVSPEDIELFNNAVRSLDNVLCKIQDKYGDEVMLLSCEDAIILADCRNNRKEELSIIRTKGNRDIDEIEIIMDNAIDD
ncbi:DNA-directed RNA polymerase subunit alpha C-terminal domain-containing protein [Ruminococcus sp.]|uniref:DNA-directed RNA polymerase subunit alpha C-terminal domain-containing protein n=1 Tax=Ruminococcus sp. TaxID=41978 RepID=UPI0025D24563|nr:DNA-directed RNA polymerase subunit alpha C-terminal domain-containing protein [Ruminococcus sp.]